eukprot:scaffold83119_cov31-Tisochrysis_lutea.AAC.4
MVWALTLTLVRGMTAYGYGIVVCATRWPQARMTKRLSLQSTHPCTLTGGTRTGRLAPRKKEQEPATRHQMRTTKSMEAGAHTTCAHAHNSHGASAHHASTSASPHGSLVACRAALPRAHHASLLGQHEGLGRRGLLLLSRLDGGGERGGQREQLLRSIRADVLEHNNSRGTPFSDGLVARARKERTIPFLRAQHARRTRAQSLCSHA